MAGEGQHSPPLGADGQPVPHVHHGTNALTEHNRRGLERLAYWRKGGKGATGYLLNQIVAEYLAQCPESQWPLPPDYPVRLSVDASPKVVLLNESQPDARRSQRNYSLPFKLAVVGEVGRGELSYKQAQRRHGIQGRTTVLNWCRRYATHFANAQATGPNAMSAAPGVNPTLEQRIKQLEAQVRQQKRDPG